MLPTEVNDSLRVDKTGAAAMLTWNDPPGGYNVYCGLITGGGAWEYNHQRIGGPLADSSFQHDDTPPSGALLYYLVSRTNACGGESILGHASDGASIMPAPKRVVVTNQFFQGVGVQRFWWCVLR